LAHSAIRSSVRTVLLLPSATPSACSRRRSDTATRSVSTASLFCAQDAGLKTVIQGRSTG
jgi:hypothetical protein